MTTHSRTLISLLCLLSLGSSIQCSSKKDIPAAAQPDLSTDASINQVDMAKQADTPEHPTPKEATNAGKVLEMLQNQIAFNTRKVEKRADDWLAHQALANAYMQRARITHDWSDWDAAKRHVDEAFKVAKKGSGPFITRANLKFSLHHFPEVDADLDAASKKGLLQNSDKATIASRRAELAMQRGKLEDAKKLMDEAYALHKNPAIRIQQGVFAFKTGRLDEARKLMDEAIASVERDDTMTLGWATLQRGIVELDSGNTREANAFFSKANERFSGWYLIEEHLAETLAIMGKHQEAREMYESIVARVPSGEFMEALADTCAELGDEKCATEQRERARKTYLEDIKSHPQAAYGHGMDFFLQGDDTVKMLEIAQANYTLRPGHDAGTRLAQAHIRAGELDKAEPLIKAALDAGWSTADVHATAATLYTLQGGKDRQVKAQSELASKRHPEAMQDIAWLKPVKP